MPSDDDALIAVLEKLASSLERQAAMLTGLAQSLTGLHVRLDALTPQPDDAADDWWRGDEPYEDD